jgi:DNA-binding transcriptional ArsR family regulator
VRVEGSPVYDFLAALFAVSRHGRGLQFDVGDGWVQAARRALGRTLLQHLADFAAGRALFVSLVSLLERQARDRGVVGFIRQVEDLPADELVLVLLTSTRAARPAREALRAVLAERGRARAAALRRFAQVFPEELGRVGAVRLARRDPEVLRERLVQLLTAFYERVYAAHEAEARRWVERDVVTQRRLAERLLPEAFVEEATGGLVPDPTVVAEVVVAPSWFVRPYTLVADHVGVRTYVVPTKEEADGGEEEAVLRVARALSDETRLRILRMLAAREMYAQQVAQALGTSHVTALHHLAALRAARLVRVVERGPLRYYVLRREALEAASAALARFPEPSSARPEGV